MNFGSLNCYRVTVHTTNTADDTFSLDGKYYDCEEGQVYVMAIDIEAAAREIPSAIAIERVGFALQPRLAGNEQAVIERLSAAVRDAHVLIDNDLVIPWIMAHKLDDVLGIDEQRAKCPIGMDHTPDMCSAGTCVVCLEMRHPRARTD